MQKLAAPLWDRSWAASSRSGFAVGDGYVAVATYERKYVDVYETVTGKQAATLTGHSDVITSIKFAEDGMWTASDDGTIRLWDARGRQRRVLQPHDGPYPRISAMDIDGDLGCSTAGDYHARVWRRDTGEEVLAVPREEPWGSAMRLSQDRLITGRASSAMWGYGLKVVDIATQKTLVDQSAQRLGFKEVASYLKDIDLGANKAAFSWLSQHASVHDLRNFRCSFTLNAGYQQKSKSAGATLRPVYSVRFADDFKVVTTCEDLKVWDLRRAAKPVAVYGGLWSAAAVDSGALITASERTIAVWNGRENI